MNVPKPSLPLAITGLWLVTLTAELTLLQRQWARSERARLLLDSQRKELGRLWQQSPAPTVANERAVRAALAAAAEDLARCRQESDGLEWAVPADSVAGFFSVARFAEQMRRQAADAGVEITAGGRFGFESYAQEGPITEDLEKVSRQQAVLSRVLPVLLEAGPRSLLAVRRETTKPPLGGAARAAPGESVVLPPPRSIRQEGLVEADAFQVEFSGETPVLRHFLNGLTELPAAIVVRSVEVEPWPPSGRDSTPLAPLRNAKFTVTLEYPRLVTPPVSP